MIKKVKGGFLMIYKLLCLAVAGSLGTIARYGLSGLIQRYTSPAFPWGTITVNITGCFFAGLLWSLFENRWTISGETRTIVLVGFMGAFTTLSTMILETSHLVRAYEWLYAAGNLAIQNGFGFLALLIGIYLGKIL